MLVRYSPEKKDEWDTFISESKNGLFLFYRDYMEYHARRFTDYSLMFHDGNRLLAVFPANIDGNLVVSHGGLTFGGFITGSRMKVPLMLDFFEKLRRYLKDNSVKKLVYKCIPYIYHQLPAEEDRYALFRIGAKLCRRDVTATVAMEEKLKFQELRLRGINKGLSSGVAVKEIEDFDSYWTVLQHNLKTKYDTVPVHTVEEIKYLHSKFPENIKLFCAFQDEAILAGVVIYESSNVAHAQYIASSDEGHEVGALDVVFSYLLNEYYRGKKYFDFGISTEKDGMYLNEGLINYKEGFGARAVVHDFYEVDL
jgi:hypothetical protein